MSEQDLSVDQNLTQFFIGTPKLEEIQQYFLRQKRLADLKVFESPEIESSPELSESFEMYLQQRKQKVEDEKRELNRIVSREQAPTDSPRSSRCLNNTTFAGYNDTLAGVNDDSFLRLEKECENTLNLDNQSAQLFDLTSMASPRKSLRDETHLNDIEAPSFMFNNTSMMKNSPVFEHNANRPSTILEVSESSTNRTQMTSYRTAMTRSTLTSEYYRTAEEDSFETSEMMIKMPKIKSFYDSLENTTPIPNETVDLTKDSLEDDSHQTIENSSDEPTVGDSGHESIQDSRDGQGFDDTLERIEFMLEQAKMQEEEKQPRLIPVSPMTPRPAVTPKNLKPKVLTPATAIKNSPLIKFSPVVSSGSAFKKPTQSASKPSQLPLSSKKFMHVQSPIASYIKNAPSYPLQSTSRAYPGFGSSPKNFNFRDSDSFVAKENESMNTGKYQGSSLPLRAKTKSSAVTQLYDHHDSKKTPGGKQIRTLLSHASPTVVIHQGHKKTPGPAGYEINQNLHDETALSEQSFADLSLMSGNVSLQVVEGVKRMK